MTYKSIPPHIGYYPRYHGLWHLYASGLDLESLIVDGTPVPAWQAARQRLDEPGARPTRIVLVDTPVAKDHPNLAGALANTTPVDVTTDTPDLSLILFADTLSEKLSMINHAAATLADKARTVPADPWVGDLDDIIRNASLRNFASHGTAMAGIMAARPVTSALFARPETKNDTLLGVFGQDIEGPVVTPGTPDDDEGEDGATGGGQIDLGPDGLRATKSPGGAEVIEADLPYSGADPTAEIYSIGFTALTAPHEFLTALEAAKLLDPDLIVMSVAMPVPPGVMGPAEVVDEDAMVELVGDDGLWTALKTHLLDLSQTVPIFCAAGNTRDVISFPASLDEADNGIFAVGAMTSNDEPASYSPTTGVSIFAFSGDAEVYNRAIRRRDRYRQDPSLRPRDWAKNPLVADDQIMAQEMILATDPPGPFGYSLSPYEDAWVQTGEVDDVPVNALLDFASNFSAFNGTSAAVALAAGLISLGFSSQTIPAGLGPVDIKQKLASVGPRALTWADIEALGQEEET